VVAEGGELTTMKKAIRRVSNPQAWRGKRTSLGIRKKERGTLKAAGFTYQQNRKRAGETRRTLFHYKKEKDRLMSQGDPGGGKTIFSCGKNKQELKR